MEDLHASRMLGGLTRRVNACAAASHACSGVQQGTTLMDRSHTQSKVGLTGKHQRTCLIVGLAVRNVAVGRPAVLPLGVKAPAGMRLLSVSVCRIWVKVRV